MPFSSTPASCRIGPSGVPAETALPIPPSKNGSPVLPEHSMVKVTSARSRCWRSASESVSGVETRPLTFRAQLGQVNDGLDRSA